MNEPWKISLFGGLSASRGETRITRFRTQKNAALLAFLAYHLDRSHPREVLIDLLWPDHEIEAGRNCLSVALSSLRSQFEGPDVPARTVIVADRASVRLNPDTVTTDVHDFRRQLRNAAKSDNPAEKAMLLDAAVSLFAGQLLPGFYEDWVSGQQSHLTELFFQALETLIAGARSRGELAEAINYARRGAAVDPFREDNQVALIVLLDQAGRLGEAAHHAKELIALFEQETGLPPTGELRGLAATLEKRLSARETPAAPSAAGAAPQPVSPPMEGFETRVSASASPAEPRPLYFQASGSPILGSTFGRQLPSGTVTVLVGQAAPPASHQATDAGEPQADIFATSIRANGGGSLPGDGGMTRAVFSCAADALTAALSVQRALQAGPHAGPRIVLDTGDVPAAAAGVSDPALYRRLADRASLILATIHPNQTVVTESTAALLRRDPDPTVALRDLGVFRFGRQTERVAMALAPGLADEFPRLNAPTGESPSVPISVNRFFGRLSELEELSRMITEGATRLVTLTGPGGVGKTRLAAEAARRLVDRFDGRVYFATLPDNDVSDALPRALLTALRIAPNPAREAMAEAVEALSVGPTLLVLDNFDQHVESSAMILRDLVEHLPSLSVLATSRRVLDISIEHEYRVAPLPLPSLDTSLARLASAESLQFLVDRARAVRPDFQITKGNAETLARVCIALEGIPLAIELAAARVSVLTERQILAQLDNRLKLLSGGKRDSHRHRTMRSAIEWSYDLLPDDLRIVFRHLSMFRGGFTLEAATEVCAAPDIFDLLWLLRQFSLLQVDSSGAGLRFRMLEMVREFAEDLLSPEEVDTLVERHWSSFYQFAHRACAEMEGPSPGLWLDQIEQDLDNIRLALQYPATDNRRLYFCHCLHRFWITRGYVEEGRGWLAPMLKQCVAADANWRAMAESAFSALEWASNRLDTAREHSEQALELYRECGLVEGEKHALNTLGNILAHQGRYAEAGERFRMVLELTGPGDAAIRAVTLGNLANVEGANGNHQAARAYQEQGIALLSDGSHRLHLEQALSNYGSILSELGEIAEADIQLRESYAIGYELRDRRNYAVMFSDAAHVAFHKQDMETSALLLGASDRFQREVAVSFDPATDARIAEFKTRVRAAAGDEIWNRSAGQAMTATEDDLLKIGLAAVGLDPAAYDPEAALVPE